MGIHSQRVLAFPAMYVYGLNSKKNTIVSADEIVETVILSSKKNSTEFATTLFHITVEHLSAIDSLIRKRLQNIKFSNIHWVTKAILRIAFAEMIFLNPDVEKSMIINEAITLAKVYDDANAYKMINAILDKTSGDDDIL